MDWDRVRRENLVRAGKEGPPPTKTGARSSGIQISGFQRLGKGRAIATKFPGNCSVRGARINRGDRVRFFPRFGIANDWSDRRVLQHSNESRTDDKEYGW